MATVRPFQGVLYDADRVDLARVVAPPYDVITPQDQLRYYARDPRNVVRLIAGEVKPTDDATDNKYTRAAAFFNDWLKEGILKKEPAPGLYVYRQQFVDPTVGVTRERAGIIGVVELEPFGAGVLPHERTHARAKADRLSLTSAVGANLSMVFALYDDPRSAVPGILGQSIAERPRMSITTEGNERHEVWSVRDADAIRELDHIFAASQLYMADGHHRYETAMNFRNKQRQQHPEAPRDAAFNYVLALLVDVRDPGLAILPTHRILRDLEGFDGPALLRRLSARHVVTTRANRRELVKAMQDVSASHRIGLALEGQGGELLLATVDMTPLPTADPVSQLDVSVLHREILEGELGVAEAMLEQERYVSYSRDVDPVLDQVERGKAQAAFLLRPPSVNDVVAVARAGLVMPQKSTYFYPKPLSGVVFNPLDPAIRIPPV